ncbi:bacteriohemerythrin [Candidatus Magnetaquicoccus inordinatus]|uniref:bacteriohemerythrin n=1 Tax=Candidatus Magnetaquicoccus inordinatus TaxID=2496818 RepID=UPI00102BE643|nr:bacteriohemerythrin [Candidatus Magnetaquicoccus inordinatus]
MDAFVFTDDLLVHVDVIDNDHKELYEITNILLSSSAQSGSMDAIVSKLWQYTRDHFRREEELMASKNYNKLNEHKTEHEYLVFKLEQLTGHLMEEGSAGITAEMSTFLTTWLKEHIESYDRQFALSLSA